MTTPDPASSVPTVRHAVAQYVEHLTAAEAPADRRQLVLVALQTLLEPALEEPVTALTNLRLVLLSGELKVKTSPKTGRPLAASTFRKYVLVGQTFAAWAAQKWPRPARRPGAPAATQDTGSGQHLGELIRLLRTDAGLTRVQLGETTRLGAIVVKRVELGQQRLTRRQLDLLLQAPAMAGLLAWAEREGVPVELATGDVGVVSGEDGGNDRGSGGGVGGGT